MKLTIPKFLPERWSSVTDAGRRKFLAGLIAGSGLALLSQSRISVAADESATTESAEGDLRFPGDPVDNKVVYQFNQGNKSYTNSVLFSVGAMLRKYGDNIDIVVVGIGPGIHILAKNPERPVSDQTKAKVSSLMQYGVKFVACGNTMKSLGWKDDNIIEGVEIVEVGAAALMEYQKEGYSYISW